MQAEEESVDIDELKESRSVGAGLLLLALAS